MTESLLIYEGGVPGLINIKSYVPPSLFCPSNKRDGCKVTLYAGVRAAREKTCPDQRTITQAVIVWNGPEKDAFCGSNIDENRWNESHVIMVKGVVDALKDGDQQRTVEVWARFTSDLLTTELNVNLGQVKVSGNVLPARLCTQYYNFYYM